MKRNLKYIIPLLVVAGTSATSCNNSGIPHLKRDEFKKETTFTELSDKYEEGKFTTEGPLTLMRKRQFDPSTNVYNTPTKGKVTTNLNIALSGGVRVLVYDISSPYKPRQSIDLNNINILINDKITTLWNMQDKDCGDYFSCESKSGKSYFIEKGKDKSGNEAWYKYYDTPIVVDGKENKYYENVTSWVNEDFNKSFKNFALYQIAASSGWFNHANDGSSLVYSGFGLGITGFGGDMVYDDETEGRTVVRNAFMPGAIGRIPAYNDCTLAQAIDIIAGNDDLANIIPITTKCTKENDNKNISMAIDVKKFDFKNSQSLADEIIKETVGELDEGDMIAANGTGTGAIDYFSCFKNDWLHQFELTLNLNKVNLQLVASSYRDWDEDTRVTYINLKNLNAKMYVNETFEPDCGSYKKPSTDGYIDITPTDPIE